MNPTLLDTVAQCSNRWPNERNMLDSTFGIKRYGYKIYPQSLENKRTPYLFAQNMAGDRSTVRRCLAAIALLEMLEEEDDRVPKRGKTRQWIKRREEKGYFTNIVRELMIEDSAAYREMMRMNHEDFKKILKAIEPDITPRQVMGCLLYTSPSPRDA